MISVWKAQWGLPQWKTHDILTLPKTTFGALKETFLAKEWNSFHLMGKKLYYVHFEDFLNYECELYSKQQLTPPQPKIIVAHRISDHRLAIEFRWWLTIPIPKDNTSCHFCSYNVVESDVHLVLQCPLYKLHWRYIPFPI